MRQEAAGSSSFGSPLPLLQVVAPTCRAAARRAEMLQCEQHHVQAGMASTCWHVVEQQISLYLWNSCS